MTSTISTAPLSQAVQVSDVLTAVRAAFVAAAEGKATKEKVWHQFRAFAQTNPTEADRQTLRAGLVAMSDIPEKTWKAYLDLAYDPACKPDSSVASLRKLRSDAKAEREGVTAPSEGKQAATMKFAGSLLADLFAQAIDGVVTEDGLITVARAILVKREREAAEYAALAAANAAAAKAAAKAAKDARKADPLAA